MDKVLVVFFVSLLTVMPIAAAENGGVDHWLRSFCGAYGSADFDAVRGTCIRITTEGVAILCEDFLSGGVKECVEHDSKLTTPAMATAVLAQSTPASSEKNELQPIFRTWRYETSVENRVEIEIKGLKEDGKALDLMYSHRGTILPHIQGEAWLEGTTPHVKIYGTTIEWRLSYSTTFGGMLWGEFKRGTTSTTVKLHPK